MRGVVGGEQAGKPVGQEQKLPTVMAGGRWGQEAGEEKAVSFFFSIK